MKKVLMFLVALFAIVTVVGCGGKTTTEGGNTTAAPTQTLKIYQNKVEIDGALTDYAQAWGTANNVTVEVVTCGGDSCSYGQQILAEFQSANQPDIFVIEGMGGYNQYKDNVLSLAGEDWLDDTDLAFMVDGVPYGFPVAVEGWGMGYNVEILEAADVDPASLTTLAGYQAAFTAIQAYYDANSLNDYAVVAMAAASGMTWVTGLHNFNGYLSGGLEYSDSSVIDDLNDGVC